MKVRLKVKQMPYADLTKSITLGSAMVSYSMTHDGSLRSAQRVIDTSKNI